MTDFMESQRDWEKVQLAKLAHMLAYWQKQPVEATKEIPENIGAAGRNIGAYTAGIVGDVASIVPGAQMAAGGQAPTSEDLLEEFGRKEHWSNLPAAFVAPGPGEVKGILKAMLGLGKEMTAGVALAQALFHGTPHKFSKFELEKIGTGEGAQAYGHGLYFAESPGVAKSYQRTLGDDKFTEWADGNTAWEAYRRDATKLNPELKVTQWDPAGDIADIQAGKKPAINVSDKTIEALRKSSKAPKGHLYEVDIPDETIGKMLDWDAPLSEQPELAKALEALGVDVADNPLMRAATPPLQVKGNEAYNRLARQLGSEEAASKALNEAGIPGIRFFDGSSRAKGEGTRNIVVFNPDDIKTVKRDGELVYKAGKKKSLDEIIDIVDKY